MYVHRHCRLGIISRGKSCEHEKYVAIQIKCTTQLYVCVVLHMKIQRSLKQPAACMYVCCIDEPIFYGISSDHGFLLENDLPL